MIFHPRALRTGILTTGFAALMPAPKEIEVKLELPLASLPRFKKIPLLRGEKRRPKSATEVSVYFDTDKQKLHKNGMRHCLEIRNQYAHWVWWDDRTGRLAFANVEDLTKYKSRVTGFGKLKAHHVDATLLKAQETYFVYADDLLLWVNYEGRFKRGKLGDARLNPVNRPKDVKQPKLCL